MTKNNPTITTNIFPAQETRPWKVVVTTMAESEFNEEVDKWVAEILQDPKNLASETELTEQARVALKLFLEADRDKSSSLSYDELKTLCDTMGLPIENDEEEALRKLDKDGDGSVEISEWTQWWLKRISYLPNPIKQQEVIAINTFRKFDEDNSGQIDAEELQNLIQSLGANFTDNEMMEALSEMDEDGSGKVEESEFVSWWTQRAANNRRNVSLISIKLKKLAKKAAQLYYTDIFSAAWNQDILLLKSFLDNEPRFAKAVDTSEYGNGWTALQYASYRGFTEGVELLLNSGADVNATNQLGFTALFYAAQQGQIDICELLLKHNADPTIYGKHEEDETIFMCPVDFVTDYPSLQPLFLNHEKCQVLPIQPNKEGVTCELWISTGKIKMKLDLLPKVKANTSLLIVEWKLSLTVTLRNPIGEEHDDDSLSFFVLTPSKQPIKSIQQGQTFHQIVQTIQTNLTPTDLNQLLKLFKTGKDTPATDSAAKKIRITLQIAGIDSMGSIGPASEAIEVTIINGKQKPSDMAAATISSPNQEDTLLMDALNNLMGDDDDYPIVTDNMDNQSESNNSLLVLPSKDNIIPMKKKEVNPVKKEAPRSVSQTKSSAKKPSESKNNASSMSKKASKGNPEKTSTVEKEDKNFKVFVNSEVKSDKSNSLLKKLPRNNETLEDMEEKSTASSIIVIKKELKPLLPWPPTRVRSSIQRGDKTSSSGGGNGVTSLIDNENDKNTEGKKVIRPKSATNGWK